MARSGIEPSRKIAFQLVLLRRRAALPERSSGRVRTFVIPASRRTDL